MTKNPFLNALAAALYIVVVVNVIFYFADSELERTSFEILIPIIMISLFTLSAAIMGYLFLYQPIVVFMNGDKKGGVKLFLQTVGVFAGITALLLLVGTVLLNS